MIKKLLLASVTVGCSVLAHAQVPTLLASNVNPVINDSFINVICDETGIVQGSAGVNITWDFHTLPTTSLPDSITLGSVMTASLAPGYSSAISAANRAIVTPATTVTNFYIAGSAKLSLNAIYMSTANFAVYTDPIDLLQYPFTYLSTFNDNYAGVLTYSSVTLTENGTVNVLADGWGTLILPPTPPSTTNRSYDSVLRVRSSQTFTDSLDIFGSTPQTYTIETYTWYRPGYHSALMTISTVSGPSVYKKTVSYARQQVANHVSVPSITCIETSLSVFPNPATGELNISFTNPKTEKVKITLTDMLGREVAVIANEELQGTQNISYGTGSLSKGLYLLQVQSASGSVARKVAIQ